MFSGAGLYCEGVMFGLVVSGTIYLKADETSIANFKREGSGRFTYTRGQEIGPPERTRPALLAIARLALRRSR
jgi:TfoX/Sxy family transcriptional regulator of competence genes